MKKYFDGSLEKVENYDIHLLESNPTKFWKGVTSIGSSAFEYCSALKNIEIPNTVTRIGGMAFAYCKSILVFLMRKPACF